MYNYAGRTACIRHTINAIDRQVFITFFEGGSLNGVAWSPPHTSL